MTLLPIPDGPLRNGYTTGACATACTKAALLSLITQEEISGVSIELPIGESVFFKISFCSFNQYAATCTTIKDAGDDPDVTHGAEIGCKVSWNQLPAIRFVRGEGVGIVTLPGLQIPVGDPAINPVPRKMMSKIVEEIQAEFSIYENIDIEVFVKNGKEIALKTLNSRIGILDGISILGTTGIVKPFSADAYIASITQGIDVAIANGCSELVINSGGRTENLLKKIFPTLPSFGFIQYGNWIGETLKKVNESSIENITMGIMLGKAVKLAEGTLDTHSGKSTWDKNFIYQIALNCGYKESLCKQILELNIARRLVEIIPFDKQECFYRKIYENCYMTCSAIIPGKKLTMILFDANDNFIVYSRNDH